MDDEDDCNDDDEGQIEEDEEAEESLAVCSLLFFVCSICILMRCSTCVSAWWALGQAGLKEGNKLWTNNKSGQTKEQEDGDEEEEDEEEEEGQEDKQADDDDDEDDEQCDESDAIAPSSFSFNNFAFVNCENSEYNESGSDSSSWINLGVIR